jgi:hypothetical protein
MPALLRHTECRVCGHRHNFCLLTDDLAPGREYEYICPENGKKATLRPTSAAEVLHSAPQGAVALTPAVYDAPRPGHESPQGKFGKPLPQPRPEAGQPQPGGLLGIEQEVQEIGREVQGLAARLGELEGRVPPAGAVPSPHSPPPAGTNEQAAGPTRLQEVLPEVKDLAGKVGGLEKLSDIVETLKAAKKE